MQAEDQQAQPAVIAAPREWTLPKRPSVAANIWKFTRRKPLGAFGMLIVITMLAMTLGTPKAEFGTPDLPSRPLGFELGKPWLARFDAEAIFRDANTGRIARYNKPSADHWLGTDKGGRDTYSRMVFAARRSLFIGLWALMFATVIGTTVGRGLRLLPRLVGHHRPADNGLLPGVSGPPHTYPAGLLTSAEPHDPRVWLRIRGRDKRAAHRQGGRALHQGAALRRSCPRHRRHRPAYDGVPHPAEHHGADNRRVLYRPGRRHPRGGRPGVHRSQRVPQDPSWGIMLQQTRAVPAAGSRRATTRWRPAAP